MGTHTNNDVVKLTDFFQQREDKEPNWEQDVAEIHIYRVGQGWGARIVHKDSSFYSVIS